MKATFLNVRSYLTETWQAWNQVLVHADRSGHALARFASWPADMLLYTHLVWSLDLQAFVGQEGWLPVDYLRSQIQVETLTDGAIQQDPDGNPVETWSVWSVFFWIKPTWLLWSVHVFALSCVFLSDGGAL